MERACRVVLRGKRGLCGSRCSQLHRQIRHAGQAADHRKRTIAPIAQRGEPGVVVGFGNKHQTADGAHRPPTGSQFVFHRLQTGGIGKRHHHHIKLFIAQPGQSGGQIRRTRAAGHRGDGNSEAGWRLLVARIIIEPQVNLVAGQALVFGRQRYCTGICLRTHRQIGGGIHGGSQRGSHGSGAIVGFDRQLDCLAADVEIHHAAILHHAGNLDFAAGGRAGGVGQRQGEGFNVAAFVVKPAFGRPIHQAARTKHTGSLLQAGNRHGLACFRAAAGGRCNQQGAIRLDICTFFGQLVVKFGAAARRAQCAGNLIKCNRHLLASLSLPATASTSPAFRRRSQ